MKGMLKCCFWVSMLSLTLYASLVQTAPSEIAFMDTDRLDRFDIPAGIVSLDYALADKRELVPEVELLLLQHQFEQEDMTMVKMQLLQLNLMKILIILDVVILICLFYIMEND